MNLKKKKKDMLWLEADTTYIIQKALKPNKDVKRAFIINMSKKCEHLPD